MFSATANTINNVSPTCVSDKSILSTNKCYTYPGPFKTERKWAQDLMSKWVSEWLNK